MRVCYAEDMLDLSTHSEVEEDHAGLHGDCRDDRRRVPGFLHGPDCEILLRHVLDRAQREHSGTHDLPTQREVEEVVGHNHTLTWLQKLRRKTRGEGNN